MSGGSRLLGGIPTNLYLSVSTITAIVEVWLPFMMCRICILRTLTYQVEVFCSCEAIAVIASMAYMTIMEFFDEYPTPFSPEIMMMISH